MHKNTTDIMKSFYISPSGNDSNPGTLDLPFQTIEKAMASVREININMAGDIYVYLMAGRYTPSDTLIFSVLDSGTNGYNIIYTSYHGAKPVVSGGVDISTGWSLCDGDLGARNIYQKTGIDWNFRQLYIDDQRGIRARAPNMTDEITGGPYYYATNGTYPYTVKASDIGPWANNGTAEMVIVDSWNQFRGRISHSIDNTVYFKAPENGFAFNHHDQNPAPYFFENDLALLDSEREWFLDTKEETLYYKPRSGEIMNKTQIIAPKLETLLKIEGMGPDNKVRNLKFSGITFKHSNWLAPGQYGYVDIQGGFRYQTVSGGSNSEIRNTARYTAPNSMAQIKYSDNITLEHNTFQYSGSWGIMGYEGTHRTTISRNKFYKNAGGGVAMGIAGDHWDEEDDPAYDLPDGQSQYDTISDNTVDMVALDYKDMVGIGAMLPQHMTISGNEVKNLPYTGISIGWNWTDRDHGMTGNQVYNNRIHDVLKLLQDGAGIYSLGRMKGNSKFYNNYIYDLVQSTYAAAYYLMGIYLDNGSCYKLVESNVIDNSPHAFNVSNPPNYDNKLENNYYSCNLGFIAGSNHVFNNRSLPDRNWPQEAKEIMNKAGPRVPSDYSLRGSELMDKLERYEWCDFWWEEAEKNDKPRVLLIGDSITRAYRPIVNELIKEKAYVDMLATSKAIANPSLVREIDYILGHEDFKYKIIHFNNGLHGWHISEEEYEKHLEAVVEHILDNCKGAKLILTLSTPVTLNGEKDEIDTELTAKVQNRNMAVVKIASKYKLEIDDLYTPMFRKSKLRVDDGYHYNEAGENALAAIVADKIRSFL